MWIEDYRKKRGLELDEFARKVNEYGHCVMVPPMVSYITDTLVHMLERDKNCVTHPVIANAIAGYCGATAEQRDMIVAPIHRGTWEPGMPVNYAKKAEHKFNNNIVGAKPVVKINRRGEVIASYQSIAEAARHEPHNEDIIRTRCKRRIDRDFSAMFPYTYRYQDEWQEMDAEQRMKDIHRQGEVVG